MKNILLPVMFVSLSFMHGNAQLKNAVQTIIDSAKKTLPQRPVEKFPNQRDFEIQFEQFGPTNFAPELRDKAMGNGEIKRHYRVRTSFNVPIVKKQRWSVAANLRYKYEEFEFGDFNKSSENNFPKFPYNQASFQYFSAGLTFVKRSTFFHKRAIHTATVIADGSNGGFERIKGFTTFTVVLKATQSTTIAIGVNGFIDQSALFPVLPILIYQHKFKNTNYTLDFTLPQRVQLRRAMGQNGRLSLGSDLETDLVYLYLNQPGIQGTFDYRQLEVRSGITYDHYMGNRMIATLRAGINNVIVTRGVQKNQPVADYLLTNKQDATGYLTVSLSYNPFK